MENPLWQRSLAGNRMNRIEQLSTAYMENGAEALIARAHIEAQTQRRNLTTQQGREEGQTERPAGTCMPF